MNKSFNTEHILIIFGRPNHEKNSYHTVTPVDDVIDLCKRDCKGVSMQTIFSLNCFCNHPLIGETI